MDRCAPLLTPRSIAVVGASTRPGPGQRVVANLRRTGFSGPLYLINPRHAQVGDLRAYPRLDALPEVPDLVVLAVNREIAVQVLTDASALGCPAAIMLGAGFGEADDRGRELEDQVRSVAASMALMGPNCLGHINVVHGVAAYSGPLVQPFEPGNIALVSNSGALACTLTGAGAERGIRFSHVITTGNQLGLTAGDYIRYLSQQEEPRVIGCYLEGFQDGRAMLAAFHASRDAGQAVVLLKAGRSAAGGEAARTHTGALSGSHAIQHSLWEQEGVLLADDLEDFLALVELASKCRPLAGPRLGIITISGGERLLLADEAERAGLPLATPSEETLGKLEALLPEYATPANPLDTTGAGLVERDGSTHAAASAVLAADAEVDLVLISQDVKNGWVQAEEACDLFYDGVVAACEATKGLGKPVVVLTPTTGHVDERARCYLHGEGIPLLFGLRTGMSALAQVLGTRGGEDQRPSSIYTAREAGGRPLGGFAALQLVRELGIDVWPTRLARDEEEAVAAARDLGYPVALKLEGETLLHRTDVGGVRLHLADETAVRSAWRDLAAILQPTRVLVQPMVPGGVELFVGAWKDQQFGPVILFGAGGTEVELESDLRVGLAPLDGGAAARLVRAGKVWRLLGGWRGAPAADVAALTETLEVLSRVAIRPEVRSLDVNPLVALPQGVAVIDVKLIVDE